MLKAICDICHKELLEFGGLLFSPPDTENKVTKNHLCVKCYNKIREDIKWNQWKNYKSERMALAQLS